jgi:hypothetical protein
MNKNPTEAQLALKAAEDALYQCTQREAIEVTDLHSLMAELEREHQLSLTDEHRWLVKQLRQAKDALYEENALKPMKKARLPIR